MKRSEAEKDEIETIKGVQRIAYLLIFSICGFTLIIKRDEIVSMWAFSLKDLPHSVLRVALFLCAIALAIRWIAATAHEFQLWLRNLHYVFIKSQVYVAMLGLAVVLGIMLILAYNILAFTAFFSCYLLFQLLDPMGFKRTLQSSSGAHPH